MKIYKVEYWFKVRSKPHRITEISKSGATNGLECSFCDIKLWQRKIKNGIANGITDSKCWDNTQNNYFKNFKKGIFQGIEICFKK